LGGMASQSASLGRDRKRRGEEMIVESARKEKGVAGEEIVR